MDDDPPIAYEMLQEGVPVLASDGETIGTVGAVLSAPEKDIFHGLLVNVDGHGVRFLEAAAIASLHEHGVEARIDSAAARDLPEPEHRAPVYDEDPGAATNKWTHWAHKLSGRGDWNRER